MELHKGYWSNPELSDWFGCGSYETFKKKKRKLFIELKNYCYYEERDFNRGVIIKEIFEPVYKGPNTLDIEGKFFEYIKEAKSGLVTAAGMARKLMREKGISNKDIYIAYANTFSSLLEGKELTWGIKVDEFNTYRKLTKVERDILNICLMEDLDTFLNMAIIVRQGEENKGLYRDFANNVIKPFKTQTGLNLALVVKVK